MFTFPLKPISVNESYKGKRYRTPEHKLFKDKSAILFRNIKGLPDVQGKKEFFVIYKFYISKMMDIDNGIKGFQDALCDALNTDDRYISGAYVRKIGVKKGNEKIEFDIFLNEYDQLQAIYDLGEEICQE